MYRVVLTGATGSLGAKVATLLHANNVHFDIVTRDPANAGGIYWDYKRPIPREITSADCIVHCARGPSFSSNVAAVKLLVTKASSTTKLILIGSNCVFAQPSSRLARIFFSGDAYILEKRKIEKLAKTRPHTILLRPTIVRDEGGWDAFLSDIARASKIRVPRGCGRSRLKVIDSIDVAKEVMRLIIAHDPKTMPAELFSEIVPLSEFVGEEKVAYDASNNTYFESRLKNLALVILCSFFIPFWLKALVQERFLKYEKSLSSNITEEICVDGMTRLYLCGAHTKK